MKDEAIDFDELIRIACNESLDREYEEFLQSDMAKEEVSPEVFKKFQKKLRWMLFIDSKFIKGLKKTVIACVIIVLLAALTVLAVEPFRERVWGIITKEYSECFEVQLINDEVQGNYNTVTNLQLPVVPEGWKIKGLTTKDRICLHYEITTTTGERIFYSQTPLNGKTWLDNDEHTIKEIVLKNGQTAYLIEYKNGFNYLSWRAEYVYTFESREVDSDVLIELANTIK